MSGERLEALAALLDHAVEEVSDIAIDVLREGLDGDEAARTSARETERVLNRARAALEKSAALLRKAGERS